MKKEKLNIFVNVVMFCVFVALTISYMINLNNLYNAIDQFEKGLITVDPDGSFIPNHIIYACIITFGLIGASFCVIFIIYNVKQIKNNKKEE